MTQSLTIAKQMLLEPTSLDEHSIEKLFKTMMNHHIDDADLYFQSCNYESWYLEDSEVKSGSYSLDKGVGIRAVSGDKTGFAYCDDIVLPSMLRAADAARSIALAGSKPIKPVHISTSPVQRYEGLNPIETWLNRV